MAYSVKFTETTPAKPEIIVEDGSLNTEKSIAFPGKNYANYGTVLAENFLHLLENFAKSTEPSNPVQGQLWYDNTVGVNLLKVWDGTAWTAAGAVKKASLAPSVANSIKGDLWVDTNNQQLYIYSGSNWLLVGPQYSSGLKTGPELEVITDTDNVDHAVLTFYSTNQRVSIISSESFNPKTTILGFATINSGVNLTTVNATSTTAPTKFWGTASRADALNVSGSPIAAANFLRGDIPSTSNNQFNVRNDSGIALGADLSFQISTSGNTATLKSLKAGGSIDININTSTTLVHIDPSGRIGLGENNSSPQEVLDVLGNIAASGNIYTTTSTNSTGVGVGSIVTNGGLSVNLDSNFGGDITTYGKIYVNNLDGNFDPIIDTSLSGAILPGSNAASGKYNIGSSTRKFNSVYANSFIGEFVGNITGSVTGSISGTASQLASPTRFYLGDSLDNTLSAQDRKSDVTSNTISFDGQGDDPAIFTAKISPDFITNKTEITSSGLTDVMLLFRPGTTGGLRKITKAAFMNNVATVPPGSIFPFAGAVVPSGYLLCDGSEVLISRYPLLYGVIQNIYTIGTLRGEGTFALPDLRGRFALGRDNMENVDAVTGLPLTIPAPNDPVNTLDAGGGPANVVTDVTADILGAQSGLETSTLQPNNLPEHRHNLNSGNAQYFAAGLPGAGADSNAFPGLGMPATSTGSGLQNSGGILNVSPLGQPFTTMNPYLTINYIIFTGTI
jgi:microcystin-dependent protein